MNKTNIGGGARPQKSKDGVKFWSQISGPQSMRIVYPTPFLVKRTRMEPTEGKTQTLDPGDQLQGFPFHSTVYLGTKEALSSI